MEPPAIQDGCGIPSTDEVRGERASVLACVDGTDDPDADAATGSRSREDPAIDQNRRENE